MITQHIKDTGPWLFQTWASFVISITMCVVGIWFVPLDLWARAFLAVGYLFTVSSAFTLAKTIRDNREAVAVVGQPSGGYR